MEQNSSTRSFNQKLVLSYRGGNKYFICYEPSTRPGGILYREDFLLDDKLEGLRKAVQKLQVKIGALVL